MGKSIIERFEAKFERVPESGCWLWTGAIYPDRGYGAFNCPPEQLAHRVSWLLYRGPIPAGAHVLHRCDVPACVNPGHLFLGDQASNMADKVNKGRQSNGRNEAICTLTEQQVRAIRADGRRQVDIAADYGVSQCAISDIKRRRTWAWLA